MLPNWNNAYRVLGLPADATGAEARAAARKMRLQARLGPVSPSRDPLLPVVRRALTLSEADINDALSRVERPESRHREQIVWFAGGALYDALCAGIQPVLEDKRADAVRFHYWKEAARFSCDGDWSMFAPSFARMARMLSAPALIAEASLRNERAGWLQTGTGASTAATGLVQNFSRKVLGDLAAAVEKKAVFRAGGCLVALCDANFDNKATRASLHRILKPWESSVRRHLVALPDRWILNYEASYRSLWLNYFRAALIWELHGSADLLNLWFDAAAAQCKRSFHPPKNLRILRLIAADLAGLPLRGCHAEGMRKLTALIETISAFDPPPAGSADAPRPVVRHESSLPGWRPPTPVPAQPKTPVIQVQSPFSAAPEQTQPIATPFPADSGDTRVPPSKQASGSMSLSLPLIYLFTLVVLGAASEIPPGGIFMALLLSFSVVSLLEANSEKVHPRLWVHASTYLPPVALGLYVSPLRGLDLGMVLFLLFGVYAAFLWRYIDPPKIEPEADPALVSRQRSRAFAFYRGLTIFFLGAFLLVGILSGVPWVELGVVMLSIYGYIAFLYHDFVSGQPPSTEVPLPKSKRRDPWSAQ